MRAQKALARISLGLSAWIEAFRLIARRPSLVFWLAFPFLLSFGLTLSGAIHLQGWLWRIIPDVQAFPTALVWIGKIASGVLISIVSGWTIAQLAWVISIPLEERICVAAANAMGRPILNPPGWWQAFRWDAKKSIFVILLGIGSLLTSFVPPATFAIHALILGFQALAFVDTQHRRGLRASLLRAEKHIFETFGLGIGLAVGMAIPIVNWVVLPIGVIAATWLHGQLDD